MGIFPLNLQNHSQSRLDSNKMIPPQVQSPPVASPQNRPVEKPENDYMKLGSVPLNQAGTYSAAARVTPVLKGFLDKVANGTVGEIDLQNMKNRLQQNPQFVNGTTATGKISDMKIFLDKVAAGTVTQDDLTIMGTKLQQVRQSSGSAPVSNRNSYETDLGFFLKKVAGGTVQPDDLQNARDVLRQMEQSGNDALFRHQHRMDSFSNNHDSDLKSFLGKVADGNVTQDDLKNMQNELQKMEQHFGFM